jgi:precorrin-3B C17-methyltransferase
VDEALASCDVLVGYKGYLGKLRDFFPGREVLSSGMRDEVQRCRLAIQKAREGRRVALVSSGDPGVYGMAGLVLEILEQEPADVLVTILPGITAASAAAALLGAPLMVDFAVVSLSDLLVSWDVIEKRLRNAAQGDFVTVLYNPKSAKRDWQIEKARKIFLEARKPSTPVGIARHIGSADESVEIATLGDFTSRTIDMNTVVIIGNSTTGIARERMVTPRGYRI